MQQLELKYRVLIGISAMTLLFVSFFISFIYSQRKKLRFRDEMDLLRETQQNQLLKAAIRSEEIERHRIAETLHDEVGAILSSAKLHLYSIKLISLDNKDLLLLEKGKELVDDVISKVRQISHNLHSNILKEFGLNEALQDFLKKVTEGSPIKAEVLLDDNYATTHPENDIRIYRLVQELINNIFKHSSATDIVITSRLRANDIQFVISHNGNGLTNEQFIVLRHQRNGMGLKNIQNRIVLLKGKIDFIKINNRYEVKFEIPLNTAV